MRWFWLAMMMIAALTLQGCATSYTLSESEVEDYLDDKLSITEQQSPIQFLETELNLNQIKVRIGRGNDKVQVSTYSELVIRTPLLPLRATLTATIAATPWYRPEDKGIYLRDLEIVSIDSSPKELGVPLEQLGKQSLSALQLFLSSQPVYTLDQNDWKQDILAKLGREITVEPGKIRFHLSAD
ncbi:DUF1439 domain-containing protein [Ferrimonas aestuarii]|uniref:DUF1439 domain-containing protein n=1 Tax=Ferrimonas aestuarii TaxID=2569539 RepID=A0A4U1BDP2_9GAMM|nr:DUF1439 domain-containing protein [Ferrimonas aestuarii]TKB49120.1 DUF1439 domain-containing protein [Ferrimonas aestuarii]